MGRIWNQTSTLLKKNWILSKRNYRGTILQIIAPLIFCFLLWILKVGIAVKKKKKKKKKLEKIIWVFKNTQYDVKKKKKKKM
jgi:hypothetical protein